MVLGLQEHWSASQSAVNIVFNQSFCCSHGTDCRSILFDVLWLYACALTVSLLFMFVLYFLHNVSAPACYVS